MATTFKKVLKNDYVQTALMLVLIVAIVFGLWFGSQLVLGTQYPALAVASGSMCKLPQACDGWSHPFEPTLHIGDLIIVQKINPKEIRTGPAPEGDVVVFYKPKENANSTDDLIVHRAIANVTGDNGLTYFRTKGDGNHAADTWNDYRKENYTFNGMISENLLVGKVVMRIPWIGHLALFMRNSLGIYIIIILLVLFVIVELGAQIIRRKTSETESLEDVGNPSEI